MPLSTGSTYAAVLPDPVFALHSTSWPANASGMAFLCTSVGFSKLCFATACTRRGSRPRSEKVRSASSLSFSFFFWSFWLLFFFSSFSSFSSCCFCSSFSCCSSCCSSSVCSGCCSCCWVVSSSCGFTSCVLDFFSFFSFFSVEASLVFFWVWGSVTTDGSSVSFNLRLGAIVSGYLGGDGWY